MSGLQSQVRSSSESTPVQATSVVRAWRSPAARFDPAALGQRSSVEFFEGFELSFIDVGEATLRVRQGGEGPPLVLLHGHPRTHATWHMVAVKLAQHFTVVCPDLRGYGQSTMPPTLPDHSQSSKRAMASDVVELMRFLGQEPLRGRGSRPRLSSRLPPGSRPSRRGDEARSSRLPPDR